MFSTTFLVRSAFFEVTLFLQEIATRLTIYGVSLGLWDGWKKSRKPPISHDSTHDNLPDHDLTCFPIYNIPGF